MVSGSDRACEYWRGDYRVDGVEGLDLHHLYRAMAWLGEELAASEQADRTLAPRCIKDLVEERLFERRRDLLSDLSVVFMDTTTLYLKGKAGRRSVSSAIRRITGRIRNRCSWASLWTRTADRYVRRCGRATQPTSPRSSR